MKKQNPERKLGPEKSGRLMHKLNNLQMELGENREYKTGEN